MTTMMSSRAFNQDVGKAKKAAQAGPVIITDRGEPRHVLLTIEAYQRLTGPRRSIVDMLAMQEPDEIDFDAYLPERTGQPRPVDFD